MIKSKKQLREAIEEASEQWKDMAITAEEMADQIKSAKKQYDEWLERNHKNDN